MSAPTASPDRPSRALWAAVLLPPALWMAQEAIGWYIGGHACAAVEPGWSPRVVRVTVQLLTVAVAGVAAALLWMASRHRRRLEPQGAKGAAAERSRFVATLAIVAGVTLLLGLALAGLPSVMVQTCGQAR